MSTKLYMLAVLTLTCINAGAQFSPAKRAFTVQTGAACDKTLNGGCMVYSYCTMVFDSATVTISNTSKEYCTENGVSTQNLRTGSSKTYSWKRYKNSIHIDGFDRGPFTLWDNLLAEVVCGNENKTPLALTECIACYVQDKTFKIQTNSTCKMMTDGGCTVNTFCNLAFGTDSVQVQYSAEAYCTPQEREAGYERTQPVHTYAWHEENGTVFIIGPQYDNTFKVQDGELRRIK